MYQNKQRIGVKWYLFGAGLYKVGREHVPKTRNFTNKF